MTGPPRTPVLGLIGAIGAGKSTAAGVLRDFGGAVVDADKLGHAVLDTPAVLDALVGRWGPRVRKPDGSADRRAIGGVVFADPAERRALEEVVFPHIRRRAEGAIAATQADPGVRFVVLDAAVMLEAGWSGVCDRLLYIDAPRAVRESRLAARSGWTPAELAAREAAQMPADEKKRHADAVIVNDGTPADLRDAVGRLLADWNVPHARD